MSKKITFIELPIFAGVVPLASGYMEAFSRKDPILASSYQFEKISEPVKTPYEELLLKLQSSDADIYAFSTYVWNAGLVRRLLHALWTTRPGSHFVLGGPQVMHHAASYVGPGQENILVCNGEGERTLAGVLRALLADRPDFSGVRGVSFYRQGQLITTEPEPRIADLSEIPSPFLEGVFEKQRFTWMLIETNRGCPFKCNYCFWGAATGARVYKYDDARIERELEWISQSGCLYLFIADANWGMLKRDVDLSKHIVECHKRTARPRSVFFCGSKNTPERVAEISRIFHEAGLIACQSVALQTMSDVTLERVNRENIKTSTYTQMQTALNQQGISSYVEIIWPLPGETLASFEDGLARLCDIGADCFLVYPLLLMNNVELRQKQQEYGLITVPDPDPNSEAALVIQTAEVSANDYEDGARYVYAVTGLYTLRGLWTLGRYVTSQGLASYAALFRDFVDFYRSRTDHPWTLFCERSIRTLEHVQFSNAGELIHRILHAERDAFDALLEEFVRKQDFWRDPVARFLFEVDLINRPYVYRNTPIIPKQHQFTCLEAVEVLSSGYLVEVPARWVAHLRQGLALPGVDRGTQRFEVCHRRSQMPYMPAKSPHDNFVYCQDVAHRMRELAPVWRQAALVASAV